MPVAPAAYHVLLGWSYLDTRGVDVVSHGNDEVAPSPYLGMGFEPVFPLDERKGGLDCFPSKCLSVVGSTGIRKLFYRTDEADPSGGWCIYGGTESVTAGIDLCVCGVVW